jgi:hypothetical protein
VQEVVGWPTYPSGGLLNRGHFMAIDLKLIWNKTISSIEHKFKQAYNVSHGYAGLSVKILLIITLPQADSRPCTDAAALLPPI